jgi:hypothetical protein
MAEIIDFAEPVKVNPYTQDVADLIAAGEGKAARITVPAGDRNKARMAFAKAANEAGKTARLRDESADKKGENITLTFTLTAKHAPRRGKDEVTTEAVAPVE